MIFLEMFQNAKDFIKLQRGRNFGRGNVVDGTFVAKWFCMQRRGGRVLG